MMSYKKAIDVLPTELLDMVQSYVDGEYIYIPRKVGNRKAWGEKNNIKVDYLVRNTAICNEHKNGVSVDELSKKYFLSPKSIQRIILTIRSQSE